MKKIIVIDRPFDMVKQFIVYDEDQKIESIPSGVSTYTEDLLAFAIKHDVKQIDMIGPKAYLEGRKEQIYEYNMNKLSKYTAV